MGFFKKPKPQIQESGNKAWDVISQNFTPGLSYFNKGGDALAAMLGVGGDGAAQSAALDNFSKSAGMDFVVESGNRMINSNQAAKGLLKSGSTLKRLQEYGQGMGKTYLNDYMNKLLGLSGLGLSAGGLLANAGQWSKGTGPTQAGMGKQMLTAAAAAAAQAAAASDERLKENIVVVGQLPDGLNVIEFNYKKDAPLELPEGRFRGVLAQQVAKIRPQALGPSIEGYLTVKDKNLFPKRID